MSEHLEIFLLGRVIFRLNGKELVKELASQKARALFIYLACHPIPISRDRLAALFYGHLPQQRARADLSLLLNRLSSLNPYLKTTRQTVAFNQDGSYWLDTTAFQEQVAALSHSTTAAKLLTPDTAAQLEATLALYQGDFLAGFHVPDAFDFNEWLVFERERLQRLAVEGLDRLINYYLATGQYQSGLKLVDRLLQLDPLYETGHRYKMLLLARSGQRTEALAHYRTCHQILAEELGVEPSLATKALYNSTLEKTGPSYQNLPVASTSFLGRETELTWIHQQLQVPTCRLLTLVGPGGIGKTRLAIEAARQQSTSFWHGVCFVPLVTVDSYDRLILAMARALKLTLSCPADPKTQLLQHLQPRELLLVLDGFEPLLSPARSGPDIKDAIETPATASVALLLEILETAPAVKMLITSRIRLNLYGERILTIHGLPVPASAALVELAKSSAVELLIARGSRVRPDYSLSTADRPAVVNLCRLVDGMPLAIELAAGWLKIIGCAEIAAEVKRNIGFLSTSRQDVPERQRNIRAVFEYSWRTLSDRERWAARHLAIFQSGFRRSAAEALLGHQRRVVKTAQETGKVEETGETDTDHVLCLLATLVDKSFLQVTPSGRYNQHPLLQQFVLEKLAVQAEECRQVQARHGRYFANFLEQLKNDLKGPRQVEAALEAAEELDNIQAAWQWTIQGRQVIEIGRCLESLLWLHASWERVFEGEIIFGQAVDMLQQVLEQESSHTVESDQSQLTADRRQKTMVLSYALLFQGVANFHLGRLEPAKRLLEKSLGLSQPLGEYWPMAFALDYFGLIATAQGRDEQAKVYLHEALSLVEANKDDWLRGLILGGLGFCIQAQDYAEAAKYFKESTAVFQELGDWRDMLTSQFLLGEVTRFSGRFAKAKLILEEGLDLVQRVGGQTTAVWFLVGLGELSLAQEDYYQVQHYLQECLAIAQSDENIAEPVPALAQVDDLPQAIRDCPSTKAYFGESLKLALSLHIPARTLPPLIRLAQLLRQSARVVASNCQV